MNTLPVLLSSLLPFLAAGFLLIAAIVRSDIRRSGLFLTAAILQLLLIISTPILSLLVYPSLYDSFSAASLTLVFTGIGAVTSLIGAGAMCLIAIGVLGQRPAED